MRPIEALMRRASSAETAKDITLGGTGDAFDTGPFWANDRLRWSALRPSERETIEPNFDSYVRAVYKRNGIVSTCVQARMMAFAETEFLYQERGGGDQGKMRDDSSLDILRKPWTNGTTGELLARMEQEASLAGNSYWTPNKSGQLRRLRPDWVTIISGLIDDPVDGSPFDINAEVLAYIYLPRVGRRVDPVVLTPDKVVHYSPIPDPEAQWRGMSWMTPLLREIQADSAATTHKLKFFENGASLGTVISYDKDLDPKEFEEYVEIFEQHHVGPDNAYRALHVGGGASTTVVGANLQQLDFKLTQGAGETRIAAAAGVGAIIARLSEGMAGSALNEGNYKAAKEQFYDMTIRPLWRIASASLEKLTKPRPNERLWYDVRGTAALQEDRADAAKVQSLNALTIKTLTDAGFTPESVIDAVSSGDLSRLVHSGMTSVQLHPISGSDATDPTSAPAAGDAAKAEAVGLAAVALKAGARNSAADLVLLQVAHDALAAVGAGCDTTSSKTGARNSAGDLELIQAAHDAVAAAGATCPSSADEEVSS